MRPKGLLGESLYRHENAASIDGRRPCDGCEGMLVDLANPDLGTGLGIDGVRIGLAVAEVQCMPLPSLGLTVWPDRERRRYAGPSGIRPERAARLRVERMHLRVLARNEDPARGDRGLGARRDHIGVAKGPLEVQPRQICGGEAPGARALEAGVGHAVSPAVPAGAR